jgi:cbb3-type cytochrome oxidase subunit 1
MTSKNNKHSKNELSSKKLWHYFLMVGLVGFLAGIQAKVNLFTPQENFDLNAFFEYPNIIEFFRDNYLLAISLLSFLIAMIFMFIDKRKK